MTLLDRIAHDPVAYAFRLIVWGLIFLALVYALYVKADDIKLGTFQCKDGICVIDEDSVKRIAAALQWLQSRVIELQGKTGCT